MKLMKKSLSFLETILLILGLFMFMPASVRAASANAAIANPGRLDEGAEYAIAYSVSTDLGVENGQGISATLNVSVSGAQLLDVSASAGSVNASAGRIVLSGFEQVNGINGNIRIRVGAGSSVSIVITGDVSGYSGGNLQQAGVNASQTYGVRSQAEIAASNAARESEEAYQASVQASLHAIEESRRQSQAEIEASKNAIIAESASKEEASRKESESIRESIEESKAKESLEAYEASSREEESRSIEESQYEATKAYLIGDLYFVPLDVDGYQGFLFAVEDSNVRVPEGYTKVELVVNCQNVLAYRSKNLKDNVYLVFGSFREGDTPAFFFYDAYNELFFPADNLMFEAVELDETTAESVAESASSGDEPNGHSWKALLKDKLTWIFGLLTFMIGSLIGACVIVLTKHHKKQDAKTETADSDETVKEAETSEETETPVESDLETAAEMVSEEAVSGEVSEPEEEDVFAPIAENEYDEYDEYDIDEEYNIDDEYDVEEDIPEEAAFEEEIPEETVLAEESETAEEVTEEAVAFEEAETVDESADETVEDEIAVEAEEEISEEIPVTEELIAETEETPVEADEEIVETPEEFNGLPEVMTVLGNDPVEETAVETEPEISEDIDEKVEIQEEFETPEVTQPKEKKEKVRRRGFFFGKRNTADVKVFDSEDKEDDVLDD